MSKEITGNEPATGFSTQAHESVGTLEYSEGLTIRQHFAAMAMQGLLSNGTYAKILMDRVPSSKQAEFLSEVSVEQADALIKELNK